VPDFASVSGLSILDCFLCRVVFLCFACLNIPEWTTQRHWQNQAHKTQDEDK
jgi:hypothetical protein